MPTVTLSRSDLFPVGTTVGIYPAQSQRANNMGPTAAVIATGVVDAAGNLSVTNAGILSYTDYVAYAAVSGSHNYARLRSTLDLNDNARGVGVATTNGTTALTAVSASTGAFAIGQRLAGANIAPGTFLIAGSGASWTMSAAATGSTVGGVLEGHGATPAVAGGPGAVGASLVPLNISRWRARVMQRRAANGTS